MELKHIAVHHAGGTQADPYASARNLTPQMISDYHKQRWNFPSRYIATDTRYAGYNVIYWPKTRTFYQCRALGEETAAQIGHNFDTFSLCVIGNFTKTPIGSPAGTVDQMTDGVKHDVRDFLLDLIRGNKRGLSVVTGTKLSFSLMRVGPHRAYQSGTDCYGTGLGDNWIRDLLIDQNVEVTTVKKSNRVIKRELLKLIAQLNDLIAQLKKAKGIEGSRGRVGDTACDGFIH